MSLPAEMNEGRAKHTDCLVCGRFASISYDRLLDDFDVNDRIWKAFIRTCRTCNHSEVAARHTRGERGAAIVAMLARPNVTCTLCDSDAIATVLQIKDGVATGNFCDDHCIAIIRTIHHRIKKETLEL